MHVIIRNPLNTVLTLSGFGDLGPHEEARVPSSVAQRYARSIEILAEEEPDKPKIDVEAFLSPYDGYGIGSIHMARGLLRLGWQIQFSGMAHPDAFRLFPELPGRAREVFARRPRVGLFRGIPYGFENLTTEVRVGWTMWDTTRLPADWVPLCNTLDHLIVPSKAQKEIFVNSGVTVPIHCVPEPLDLTLYPEADRPTDRATFTFFSVARMCSRKCPVEMVECFQRAFPTEQDVRLVLKTRDGQFGMGGLGLPRIEDPRIRVINDDWSLDQLVAAFHDADAGLFLSHGEGFFHGPVQAMATGLPVITPDHSGASVFANDRYNYPVGLHPQNPVVPTDYYVRHMRSEEYFEWWEQDYDRAVSLMREIYRNRDKAREKGRRAAKWARTKFDLQVTAKALDAVLRPLVVA